jgi:mannose-6-phosphate isomerase
MLTKVNIPVVRPKSRFVSRPWGSFRQYAHNEPCTVSLMTVEPGQRLSLQSHKDRAELWIVLDHGVEVTVGERRFQPEPGEEIWISANQKHRLAGVGDAPARVLEVAFGDWRQNDIARFEDDYDRLESAE